ncbi:cytochrome P450 [Apiospora arundinis]
MTELMITVARTMYQLDIRQAPGSTKGGGTPELGWGARDRGQYQLVDAFVSLRHGPEVQFRSRVPGALHGGAVAVVIYFAASTHLSTTLVAKDQPDILALHYDFLRPFELCDSLVIISDLKPSAATSSLRLDLSRKGKLRVTAQVTATNFNKLVGPTTPTAWALHPLPAIVVGEVLPSTRRQLVLSADIPIDGVCDAWNTIHPGEPPVLTNPFKELTKSTMFNNTVTLDINFKRRFPKEGV